MADPELQSGLKRLVSRVGSSLRECGDAYPYYADSVTGRWFTTADGNWCGGHWVSMLWMAYSLTGDQRYREAALSSTEPLRARLAVDDMFRGLIFYYCGARAYEIAKLEWQRELALKAARAMAGMYDEKMRQISIGEQVHVLSTTLKGRAISAVDNIYACLVLPWWAWRETGESLYRDICSAHADRTIELFIRPDGSTDEFIEFDLTSGQPRRRFTLLGCAHDSCWSRGQAWCIAGLALAYEYSRERRYLEMTRKATQYFIDHSPEDHVPYYDFLDPKVPQVERDSSASAIMSAALLRFFTLPDLEPEAQELAEVGKMVARSLVRHYLTPLNGRDKRPPGMLLKGCFNKPGNFATDCELIWGDFYLMEGLYTLNRVERL